MSFNVGDIVRKIGKTQKYKIIEIIGEDCKVHYEPNTAPDVILKFHQKDLELA
jgi:NADPH-dependent curcumin reductase CurA